jgi:hypothetical protein
MNAIDDLEAWRLFAQLVLFSVASLSSLLARLQVSAWLTLAHGNATTEVPEPLVFHRFCDDFIATAVRRGHLSYALALETQGHVGQERRGGGEQRKRSEKPCSS